MNEQPAQVPTAYERWCNLGRLHGGEILFCLFYLYNQGITLHWLPFPSLSFPNCKQGLEDTVLMAPPALTLDSRKPQFLLVSLSLALQPAS